MNALYQQLQGYQQPQSQVPPQNNMIQQLASSRNPMQMLQNMAAQTPQGQAIMQAYQTSGMSPKEFFYKYAQQKGIDPNQFLNSLQG
jgi:hypothetical protein